MIGIIVKALLGNTWNTWPLISNMLRVKRGKKCSVGRGLYYITKFSAKVRAVLTPCIACCTRVYIRLELQVHTFYTFTSSHVYTFSSLYVYKLHVYKSHFYTFTSLHVHRFTSLQVDNVTVYSYVSVETQDLQCDRETETMHDRLPS